MRIYTRKEKNSFSESLEVLISCSTANASMIQHILLFVLFGCIWNKGVIVTDEDLKNSNNIVTESNTYMNGF